MLGSSGVGAETPLSAGASTLDTVTPFRAAPVFWSAVNPTTRPPGTGLHGRLTTATLSTSHHQAQVPWKRNRTRALALPAAGPREISSTVGPRRLAVWCHSVDQLAPPSVDTSTSAMSPLPTARQSLSTIAKPPLPPVRLPRPPGSVKPQPPLSVRLTTLQPAGVLVVSNDSDSNGGAVPSA